MLKKVKNEGTYFGVPIKKFRMGAKIKHIEFVTPSIKLTNDDLKKNLVTIILKDLKKLVLNRDILFLKMKLLFFG